MGTLPGMGEDNYVEHNDLPRLSQVGLEIDGISHRRLLSFSLFSKKVGGNDFSSIKRKANTYFRK